jgi:hypothetical protein
MRILVRTINLELERNASAEVESRLREGFGPLAYHILRVKVRIAKRNVPPAGKDITCSVDVRLRPRGRLFILATDLDPLEALSKAQNAVITAVTRKLERQRDERHPTSPVDLSATLGKPRRADQSLA